MAARRFISPRAAIPITALAAGLAFRTTPAHAEASEESPESIASKKSIYDDSYSSPSDTTPFTPEPTRGRTPTDRLAEQVANSRLFLHKYAASTEDATNNLLTKAFNLEHSFTSTIVGLAPPKTSGERVMPGGLYVLVAAMGSSILVRNRNILLRSTFPLAVGVAAGWYVIPVTMGNIGDLAWRYEKKFPVVADTHLRVKESVSTFIQTGIAHSKMSVGMLEDKIGEVRGKTEDWVKKGK
ncbi:hypothetical protein BLS_001180 [Venturia inaequalis]|uniref:MICOS complex subunit n=1 Tax=Venturia inaequalis TaxID=5025 RepID=A0A8H3U2G0_VENIN|nr:hypothetical protein BLS_001180 [Venturia inaequalis]KAE9988935.1 hypothetical protein EG328_005645 [Venturia inaequalis]RDI78487.1 hypothetical protein Vi05172_g11529 [Venturia inaequalis]